MEKEVTDQQTNQPAGDASDSGSLSGVRPAAEADAPPVANGSCPGCAPAAIVGPPTWVYALGKVEVRFPSLAVEKEFRQATARGDTASLTDMQAMHSVLTQRQNRYLARQLCWVLTVEGIETYILSPRDTDD